MANFSQIQTFIEVAHTGSFIEASRRLFMPRSTISARIKALEERLNVRLLHRTTRQVTLTDEGRQYLLKCEEAISTLLEAEAELSHPEELKGIIRITVPIDLPISHFTHVLTAFTDQHPAIQIDVTVTDRTVDLVADNIDIALRGGTPGADSLVARRLGAGQLAFFASQKYITDNQLSVKKKVSNLSGHIIFDPTELGNKVLKTNAITKSIETRNFELTKELTIQSRGIALLPQSLCKEEVLDGRLIQLKYSKPLPQLMLYIVMPTRQHLPLRIRAFIDFLVADEQRELMI